MAETIKGINVVIGAETTGLSKALADVDKKSKSIQSELKQVEKLLKFDPSNVEAIAQKQKLLTEQIEATTERLNRLKAVEQQVQEQFQRGDISEAQYRAFRREIEFTQSSLEKLRTELAAMEQEQQRIAVSTKQLEILFAATEKSVEDFADALGDKLTNAIKSGKASADQLDQAIEKIGQAALGANIDLDKMRAALKSVDDGNSIENVRKELNALSKEAGEAQKSVKDLGLELENVAGALVAGGGIAGVIEQALDTSSLDTKIEVSFDVPEESKQAIKEAVRSIEAYGVDAEEALEGVRRQWALNKNASDEANAAIVKGAAAIAKAYAGIDFTELIQEAHEVASELNISNEGALGLINALLKIGFPPEQLDIIAEYGQQLQRAGFEAEEIQAIFAAGVETGTWNIDNLLDGLKEGRIRLAEFGQEVPKATQELLTNTQISTQQLQTWGQAVAAGGEAGRTAMQEVAQALISIKDETTRNALGVQIFGTMWEDQGTNITDTILNMENHLATARENQDALNRAVEELDSDPAVRLQQAFKDLKSALEPVLLIVADIISKIAEWTSNNPTLAATITAVATAIGIIIGACTALSPILIAISTAAGAMGISIGALVAPIGIAIAAIAGLIAIGVSLYKNWDGIKAFFINLWNRVKEITANAISSIKNFIGDLIEAGKNIVTGIWEGIKSMGTWLYDKVATFVKENIVGTVKRFLGIASPSKVMAEFGRYVAEGLAAGIQDGTSKVSEQAQKMAQAISGAVQVMTGELSNALSLSNARFELQKELLGENADEAQKLALELQKLNAEKENLIAKIEVLSAAYEMSKKKLGENNETTKQYVYELEMAQIELQKMEVSIRKTSVAIEEQKKKAIEAARQQAQELRNLADEVTNVEKKYREGLAAAAEEYQKKVAEVNDKLIEDERRVTEEYEKAVSDRAKALRDFVGLFDAVTTKDVSGKQLLENLRGQVKTFEEWRANIQALAARGVDEGLIAELREMGPKAAPEIAALNTLTDAELAEYVALWRTKNEEARAEAVNQLQQQKIEMQQKLIEIRAAAQQQLEIYRAEWQKKQMEIRKNAEEELKRVEQKFQDMEKAATKYGANLMSNFIGGIQSRMDSLQSVLEQMAAMVDSYMPHSPAKRGPLSRIMEWGPALVDSLVDGIRRSLPKLESIMESMANIPTARAVPILAGGSNTTYNYNTGGNTINITVQDGEDLLRTLRRMGVII